MPVGDKIGHVVDEGKSRIVVSDHYECPESRAHYCDFKNTKNGLCPVCGKTIIYVPQK